jgi:hypothetical protein
MYAKIIQKPNPPIPPLPAPLDYIDVETEWPKQIHKRNLQRFKSGRSYIEDTTYTMEERTFLFLDSKNILYAKYDRFLSMTLFETLKSYFDKKFKDPSLEIVLYFSNVWIKREYMPIQYRKRCENFSFLDSSTQTEIVTVYHKDWAIYCYTNNPFDIWNIKVKDLYGGFIQLNMYKKKS